MDLDANDMKVLHIVYILKMYTRFSESMLCLKAVFRQYQGVILSILNNTYLQVCYI